MGASDSERLSQLRRELLAVCQRDQLLPSGQPHQLMGAGDERARTGGKSGSSAQLSITVSNSYPRLRYKIKAGRLYFHRNGIFKNQFLHFFPLFFV